jgi:hypothetical protein
MIRPPNVPATIVHTEAVKIVQEMAELSLLLGKPVQIVGRPGTGKSTSLWHVANAMGGRYCEISQASKTPKGMLEMLIKTAGRWGYHSQRQSIGTLADEVYSYFEHRQVIADDGSWKHKPQLLVVDEVQTLEAPAFRELLRIQEKCEMGLLVAGNAERLAGTRKKDAATWDQVESRILAARDLPGPSKADCESIGSARNVEGADAYELLARFGMSTNFRALTHLLDFAARLTGDGVGIRRTHLEAAIRITSPKTNLPRLLKSEAA